MTKDKTVESAGKCSAVQCVTVLYAAAVHSIVVHGRYNYFFHLHIIKMRNISLLSPPPTSKVDRWRMESKIFKLQFDFR